MADNVAAFREDLDTAEPALRNISDTAAAVPRAPGKWSAKQVIGHLIDSVSVNHERFVRAAQSDDLVFPGYDQDAWVAAQKYHERSWTDLVDLWLAYNRHLLHVMTSMPDEQRRRSREHHSLDVIAFAQSLPTAP